MLDTKTDIVTALGEILPCYYELFCDSTTQKPCITYLEIYNGDDKTGETLGYSRVQYNIKIWANSVADIMSNALLVDKSMRQLGYKRIASNELVVDQQVCKILTYEGFGKEYF